MLDNFVVMVDSMYSYFITLIERSRKMEADRVRTFTFTENELIEYLSDFTSYIMYDNRSNVDEDDIANYVMLKQN